MPRSAPPLFPAFIGSDSIVSPSSSHRFAQDEFDLGVEAAQLILGPPVEFLEQVRREAQQEWLSLGHEVMSLSRLCVERTRVDDRMDGLVTAQHDQQVTNHRSLALFVEVDRLVLFELI